MCLQNRSCFRRGRLLVQCSPLERELDESMEQVSVGRCMLSVLSQPVSDWTDQTRFKPYPRNKISDILQDV